MRKTYSFEKLEAWQQARHLSVLIYQTTRSFPGGEQFGMTLQMRRAAVSVASNIAEGTSRHSVKDQARFYEMAYGSLMELLNLAVIGDDLGYLPKERLDAIRIEVDRVAFKLSRLRNSLV